MATSTRGGMSGVPKRKRTPAPRTPPGLALLAKEAKAQRDLPKQKGIDLHGVVPFIKETINPPQTTVKIHGKSVPVSGAPVLGRGTAALDLLRHGPEQVKHTLDVGREIGAATKGKGKLPSDLDILLSGAVGFPRGGVNRPRKLSVGSYVRPADRKNYGRIVAIRGNEADVHFHNRAQGTKAIVTFPLHDLEHPKSRASLHPLSSPKAGAGIPAPVYGAKGLNEDLLHTRLTKRQAELDKVYDSLVQKIVPEVSPYGGKLSKQEQLRRNREGARAKGKKSQTVKQEEYGLAEDRLHAVLAGGSTDPAVAKIRQMVADREQVRSILNQHAEAAMAGEPMSLATLVPEELHTSLQSRLTPDAQIAETLPATMRHRVAQEGLYSSERSKRFQKYIEAYRAAGGGVAGHLRAKQELKGELPKLRFEGFNDFSPEALDEMANRIYDHPELSTGQKARATDAILDAVTKGKVPQRGQILILQKVFPGEVAEDVVNAAKQGLWRNIYEIGNIPRSIQSSFDLSALGRQALVASIRHPVLAMKNFGPMLRAATSKEYYERGMQEITDDPYYELADEGGVALTEVGKLGAHEEAYASKFVNKIPGVAGSARAYTYFLNKMRFDMFKSIYQDALEQAHIGPAGYAKRLVTGDVYVNPVKPRSFGKVKPEGIGPNEVRKARSGFAQTESIDEDKALKSLADYINNATGRGDLGKLAGSAEALNAFFFSPKLLTSRFNLLMNPVWYAKQTPYVRRQALRAMISTVAAGSTVLYLAHLAGAEVGLDPRSSNFGKMRFGNTRVDLWGGFQPLARYTAQLATGIYISSTTGKAMPLGGGAFGQTTRLDVLIRFLRSKEAPTPSLITDWLAGSNVVGEEFKWYKQPLQRLTPLLAQDAFDIYREGGGGWPPKPGPIVKGLGGYGLGMWGLGVQTYGPPKAKVGTGGGGSFGGGGFGDGSDFSGGGGFNSGFGP
jgi:hypothetical protein